MKTIAPVLSVKAVEKSVAWFQRVLDFQIAYLNQQPDEDESSKGMRNLVETHRQTRVGKIIPTGSWNCRFDE